jgi:hypothetical protein
MSWAVGSCLPWLVGLCLSNCTVLSKEEDPVYKKDVKSLTPALSTLTGNRVYWQVARRPCRPT